MNFDTTLLSSFPDPYVILKYLVLALLLNYLVNALFSYIKDFSTSDTARIPEPYTPLYKRYTIGHNIIGHIIFDVLNACSFYDVWRRELGEIYQLRGLGGDRVVFLTSERALREVTITKHTSFEKSNAARQMLSSLVGENGILLAEGETHRRLKKAVSPAMHHDALTALGDVFLEQGRELSKEMEVGGPDADILAVVRERTFAVILETCFGKNPASKETIESLCQAYITVFLEPPMRTALRILATRVFWFVDPKWFQYRNDLKQYVQTTVYDMCKQNAGRTDRKSLYQWIATGSTANSVAHQEMVETVLSFLVAGQATTSMSVCWTLYLLASHPEWQDRLVQELDNWSEKDELAKLDELPLLSRVVRESLRLYPPVMSMGKITTQPVVIDGYQLSKGTSVRIPILPLQRSPDIWGADAHEFNPDRWLKDGELTRTRMFWCTFSFGPRGCIGQRFALLEIKAFVAQVLTRQRIYVRSKPTIEGPFCTPKNLTLRSEKRG